MGIIEFIKKKKKKGIIDKNPALYFCKWACK